MASWRSARRSGGPPESTPTVAPVSISASPTSTVATSTPGQPVSPNRNGSTGTAPPGTPPPPPPHTAPPRPPAPPATQKKNRPPPPRRAGGKKHKGGPARAGAGAAPVVRAGRAPPAPAPRGARGARAPPRPPL